jgi:hypothetical protein
MRTLVGLLVSLTALACSDTEPAGGRGDAAPGPGAVPGALADPDVRRIHDRMRERLDSNGNWDRVEYLEFDWVLMYGETELIRRSHRFAPKLGDFRVETDLEGRTMVAAGNGNDPSVGRVWLDGNELIGDTAYTLLTRASNMLEADAYQLLMPYLWTETGVTLRYLGTTVGDGRELEVIELTFEDFRDDQEPKYRLFLDPESGLIVRLHRFRTAADTVPASVRDWEGWARYGPIELSSIRRTKGESRVEYENIRVEDSVPRGRFTGPGG